MLTTNGVLAGRLVLAGVAAGAEAPGKLGQAGVTAGVWDGGPGAWAVRAGGADRQIRKPDWLRKPGTCGSDYRPLKIDFLTNNTVFLTLCEENK